MADEYSIADAMYLEKIEYIDPTKPLLPRTMLMLDTNLARIYDINKMNPSGTKLSLYNSMDKISDDELTSIRSLIAKLMGYVIHDSTVNQYFIKRRDYHRMWSPVTYNTIARVFSLTKEDEPLLLTIIENNERIFVNAFEPYGFDSSGGFNISKIFDKDEHASNRDILSECGITLGEKTDTQQLELHIVVYKKDSIIKLRPVLNTEFCDDMVIAYKMATPKLLQVAEDVLLETYSTIKIVSVVVKIDNKKNDRKGVMYHPSKNRIHRAYWYHIQNKEQGEHYADVEHNFDMVLPYCPCIILAVPDINVLPSKIDLGRYQIHTYET